MTTKYSPVARLREQASAIVARLKAAERREIADPGVEMARNKQTLKFALAMDDKTLVIEIDWTRIHDTPDEALVEWLVAKMQEKDGDA